MNNQINQEEWLEKAAPYAERKYKLGGTALIVVGIVAFGVQFYFHQYTLYITDIIMGGFIILLGVLLRWYASSGKMKEHLSNRF